MQLFIFLLSFILKLYSTSASPTDVRDSVGAVGSAAYPGHYNNKGYECGNDFFSDSEIEESILTYHQYVNKGQNLHTPQEHYINHEYVNAQQYLNSFEFNTPQEIDSSQGSDILQDFDIFQSLDYDVPPEYSVSQGGQNIQQYFTPIQYNGPLYSSAESSEYILWPIKKEKHIDSPSKYSSDPYYIVLDRTSGKLIDVISKIVNNNYTKCIRRDGSRTDLSTSAHGENNGYQCAHEFLSDETIQESLHSLWENPDTNYMYLAPYVGNLYPADFGYMLWPIFARTKLHDFDSKYFEKGPYYIIIDKYGKLMDTVVEGLMNNFLRCTRTKKFSDSSLYKAPDYSSGQPMQSGYQCGKIFFNDVAIEEAIIGANKAISRRAFRRVPQKFDGPPFYELCFLWPLMPAGHIYKTGPLGIYRVVLTKSYELKTVAMFNDEQLIVCERSVRSTLRNHETSDFYCIDHLLPNKKLQRAAEISCDRLHKKNRKYYPARYEGPSFDRSGPYLTYPVPPKGDFIRHAGKDRVVVNSNCEVIGALTTYSYYKDLKLVKQLVKCVKVQDVSSNYKFQLDNNQPIIEHLSRV